MKKFFIAIVAVIFIFTLSTANVYAASKKTNYQMMKKICRFYHKTPKIVSGRFSSIEKTITHRKNKKYIIVEKIVSISAGGRKGYDKYNQLITYNKKVKKGKKIVSYLIYNPKTNYSDDIIFKIDNNIVTGTFSFD